MFILSKELLNKQKGEKESILLNNNKGKNKEKADTSICIINNSPNICEDIASALMNMPEVKKIETTNQDDYIKKHSSQKFDIIITEVEFNNKIDSTFIANMKSKLPNSKVVVYTRIRNHAIRNYLLSNGADAFIFLNDITLFIEHIVRIMIRRNRVDKQQISQ